MNNLDTDIRNTENTIASLELVDPLDEGSQHFLEEMYATYSDLERQNSNKWAQRAHLTWVCDGDTNSKFFHNATRIRKHFNSISQVRDSIGNLFSDHAGIESAFMNFYSCLWLNSSNNSFSDVLNAIPNDLPQFSDLDCDFLTRNVTREEVQLSIFELPSSKSPGPDGFNAEFYLFSGLLLGIVSLMLLITFLLILLCLVLGVRPSLFSFLRRIILFIFLIIDLSLCVMFAIK